MSLNASFLEFASSLDVEFTPAQRTLYATPFDGAPIPDDEIGHALFGFVGNVPNAARKTFALVKGARIGGTRFGALGAVHRALTLDLRKLAPGEDAYVAFVGPDMRIAQQGLAFARSALESKPALRKLIVSTSEKALVLRRPDGRDVQLVPLPATSGGSALRGRWYIFVHFIEAAFFRDGNFVVNDADLFKAVVPRVLPGGIILMESTTWAESGLLYEFFSKNFGAPQIATVARAPTRLMRTDDLELLADVDREYARDPQSAAQEYGAEFLSAGSGLFFDPAAIDKCIDPAIELPSPPQGTAHAGADWAFQNDSSALVVADATRDASDGETRVAIAYIEELTPKRGEPLRTDHVVASFAGVAKAYGATSLVGDAFYRQAIVEHLSKHGLVLEDAPAGRPGKTAVYIRMKELVNAGRVRLPAHPRLIAQLKAIVSRPVPGGGLQISSPRRGRSGGHGDIVSACVLACWEATGGEAGALVDYAAMMRGGMF